MCPCAPSAATRGADAADGRARAGHRPAGPPAPPGAGPAALHGRHGPHGEPKFSARPAKISPQSLNQRMVIPLDLRNGSTDALPSRTPCTLSVPPDLYRSLAVDCPPPNAVRHPKEFRQSEWVGRTLLCGERCVHFTQKIFLCFFFFPLSSETSTTSALIFPCLASLFQMLRFLKENKLQGEQITELKTGGWRFRNVGDFLKDQIKSKICLKCDGMERDKTKRATGLLFTKHFFSCLSRRLLHLEVF